MPKYLEKQHNTWFAVYTIPKAQRHRFGGKIRFKQTLQTDSLRVAQPLALRLVSEWKAIVADNDLLSAAYKQLLTLGREPIGEYNGQIIYEDVDAKYELRQIAAEFDFNIAATKSDVFAFLEKNKTTAIKTVYTNQRIVLETNTSNLYHRAQGNQRIVLETNQRRVLV